MTSTLNDKGYRKIIEDMFAENPERLATLVKGFLNKLTVDERAKYIVKTDYEQSEERQGSERGDLQKLSKIRLGASNLKLPQLPNDLNAYRVERYQRSERALLSCIAEMIQKGLLTKKLLKMTDVFSGFAFSDALLADLNKKLDDERGLWRGKRLSKTFSYLILDVRSENIRENGMITRKTILIAAGVNKYGHRSILDFLIAKDMNEDIWRKFFNSLKNRGLCGVKMVVSDYHTGLKCAVTDCFKGAVWQRCQDYFMKNATKMLSGKDIKLLTDSMKDIFASNDMANAVRSKSELLTSLRALSPDLAEWIKENIDDCLTIVSFPENHRKRLSTINMLMLLKKEINKASNVIEIFPSANSAERLIGAILIDQDEEWLTKRKYLNMEEIN